MKKEHFNQIKNELIRIGIIFLVIVVGFKILFSNESLGVVIRTVSSMFWIFVLPGYSIMLYWKEKLRFYERFIIGIVVSTASIGIISYHLGLIGVHIKYHSVFVPLALILIGIIVNIKKKE